MENKESETMELGHFEGEIDGGTMSQIEVEADGTYIFKPDEYYLGEIPENLTKKGLAKLMAKGLDKLEEDYKKVMGKVYKDSLEDVVGTFMDNTKIPTELVESVHPMSEFMLKVLKYKKGKVELCERGCGCPVFSCVHTEGKKLCTGNCDGNSLIFRTLCYKCIFDGTLGCDEWARCDDLADLSDILVDIGLRMLEIGETETELYPLKNEEVGVKGLYKMYKKGYEMGMKIREMKKVHKDSKDSKDSKKSISTESVQEKKENTPNNWSDATTKWKKKLRKLLKEKGVENYREFTYDDTTYEKCVVVMGDTKAVKEVMKELGGKWNGKLKCGAGWLFQKKKLE